MARAGSLLLMIFGVIGASAHFATAHETQPTMIDMMVKPQSVTLVMRLNAEALLALSAEEGAAEERDVFAGHDEDHGQVHSYGGLRALSAEDLEEHFRSAWGQVTRHLKLQTAAGKAVPLTLVNIDVSDVANMNDARPARALIRGDLPEGAEGVQVVWGQGLGTMVLLEVRPSMSPVPESVYSAVLRGGDHSALVPVPQAEADPSAIQVFLEFVPIGVQHIVPDGWDHVLFILGLFFLSPRLSVLFWQVTAFTLAHSMTLALSTFGVVEVPQDVVEPLIALSIVFVAAENLVAPYMGPLRFLVIFGFGLLHGLGFASVIESYGVPPDRMIAALGGFNLGVELGQIAVLVIAFFTVGYWFRDKPWYRSRIAVPASVAIAVVGALWFFDLVILSPA